jgi:hypothetical protein
VPTRRRLTRAVAAGTANPSEVAAWSESLPDRFIQCRDMGHTWRPFQASWDAEERCYRRVLKCSRCRTERVQLIGASGLILSGHYDYPDGYTAPAGTGRMDSDGRSALRLESVLRLVRNSD